MKTYRMVTPQEQELYFQQVYPLQDFVFSLVEGVPDLYLSGGTALTRFYFAHRLSDDLEFFIKIHPQEPLEFIQNVKRTDLFARDLAGKLSRAYDIVNEWYYEAYSRFFIRTPDFSMKIDFVREYHHYGELSPQPVGVLLNNLEDIGACKVAAFEDRCEVKDVVDLFFLSKQISLARLFELADMKRIPLAYEHLLTINTQGLSGAVLMLQDMHEQEFSSFVLTLKETAEAEIKKKEALLTEAEIKEAVTMNLWDLPSELKNINPVSKPLLMRRLHTLPLPLRNVLSRQLSFQ